MAYSLLCLVLIASVARADLFTSIEQMNRLVQTELDVTNQLQEFIQFHTKKLDEAKLLLKDFELMADLSRQDSQRFIGSPINGFLLIKKLTKDIQSIVDTLNTHARLKELVENVKQKLLLPTTEDYKGAAEAIHRLEDTYSLDPMDIARGNLSKKYISRQLNSFECFELGRIAYENQDYYHAVRWMNVSWLLNQEESPHAQTDLFDILDYLAFSTAQQGNLRHAMELTKRLLEIDPKHERSLYNMQFFEKQYRNEMRKFKGDDEKTLAQTSFLSFYDPNVFKNPRPEHVLGSERDVYEALCRGDPIESFKLSTRRKNTLKCRYINYHPLIRIAPVKEEILYDDPMIWLYHDVITEKQIEVMKVLALPKLARAIVRSPVTGNFETASYRISQSGWLKDREHPTLAYLSRQLSAITNLTMTTAEEWQIANYGIGGQYEPHYDFARKIEPEDAFDKSIGNRIATWLYYLESPEVGGATVFPTIGARVDPIRRSAAFWYNLLPSGNGDFRTRHAACPVLFGSKWVSNRWLHFIGQEFARPCSLSLEQVEEF